MIAVLPKELAMIPEDIYQKIKQHILDYFPDLKNDEVLGIVKNKFRQEIQLVKVTTTREGVYRSILERYPCHLSDDSVS